MSASATAASVAPRPDRMLYHCPVSCSRVALNALEEIGLPYREAGVALNRGAHYAPDYLAINPKAKVPVLIEDGIALTELPVILSHLAAAHPGAALLPPGAAPLSDLIWIAGALHPTAAWLFRPASVSAADPDGVRATAVVRLTQHAALVEARLAADHWWYGERWSITDMFLAWVFTLAGRFGFPLADYPAIVDLVARVEARPSFARAREVERAAAVRDDIGMPPGLSL